MKKLLLIIGFILLTGCDQVDRCLDKGGSWDYQNEVCDFEEKTDDPSLWNSLKNTTWRSADGMSKTFAGENYVFYENNKGEKKSIYQVLGSGVYVTKREYATIEFIDTDQIKIADHIYTLHDNKLKTKNYELTLSAHKPQVYHRFGQEEMGYVRSEEFEVGNLDKNGKTKALEYKTVYEKDGFEIREAFLGADFKPCHKFYEEEKGKCETIPRIHNFTCTDDQFNQEFFDCEWEKTGNLLEAGSPELYCEIEIEDTLWKVVKLTTDQTFSIYKNNELILTQETGSMCCGGVMAVKNIDGRFIVAAPAHIGEDEQQAWIFVDGKLAEKMKFQSLFAPLEIDNKAVYISRIHNQYTVFSNEKAVGEGYEEVQIYKDCLDTYWKYDIQGNGNIIDFFAQKQDGWYHVQAGYFAGFKSRQYQ